MVKKDTSKPPCLFGATLVEARKRLGITQYRLAKLSGISERYLNFLEHGTVEPRVTMVIRIGAALDIDPGELLSDMALKMTNQQLLTSEAPTADQDDDECDAPGM